MEEVTDEEDSLPRTAGGVSGTTIVGGTMEPDTAILTGGPAATIKEVEDDRLFHLMINVLLINGQLATQLGETDFATSAARRVILQETLSSIRRGVRAQDINRINALLDLQQERRGMQLRTAGLVS